MFGAYEQGADDGMLGIVSRTQYVHLPADAPNVAIVYGASGEMYQPESGVRQSGQNRSCSHGAPYEGDAATSLAKAGRYFQVADDEQHLSGVSLLSPPDADLRPSVFDRDVWEELLCPQDREDAPTIGALRWPYRQPIGAIHRDGLAEKVFGWPMQSRWSGSWRVSRSRDRTSSGETSCSYGLYNIKHLVLAILYILTRKNYLYTKNWFVQYKLICTSKNGGTSAVSLVTGFFKAERRLTCVSRWSTSSTYHRTGWQSRNTKKIVHHKKLHPTQTITQPSP